MKLKTPIYLLDKSYIFYLVIFPLLVLDIYPNAQAIPTTSNNNACPSNPPRPSSASTNIKLQKLILLN